MTPGPDFYANPPIEHVQIMRETPDVMVMKAEIIVSDADPAKGHDKPLTMTEMEALWQAKPKCKTCWGKGYNRVDRPDKSFARYACDCVLRSWNRGR